jgi:pimeloyl-ACP methyl ester carboxylesterase
VSWRRRISAPRWLSLRAVIPQERQIELGDMSFGTLEWGDPQRPLALMVHGYPDTAWTWRHLGPRLAEQGWHAVAPFTRGYAPTSFAPDDSYLISDQVDDVLALRVALGGDARAVLIGHDWGAVSTWGVTRRAPEAFDAYVALAVPPTAALLEMLRPASAGMAARQARMSWYFLYNQLPGAERTLDRVIPWQWRHWSPGYDAREDLAHVFTALADPARRRAALGYYRDNLRSGIRQTFTLRPGAPALYLHGEDDGCLQAEIGATHQSLLVPGSRFETVPAAGHFLHLEQPERVGALVEAWIGPAEARL